MKRDVQHVLAIVIRYFGGVKLGAGGLVRAYSGSLAKTLDIAPLKEVKDRATLQVSVPFAFMDTLHRLADDWTDLKKHEPEYTASGLNLTLSINSSDVNAFDDAVRNATQAQAQVTVLSNDAA